MDACPEVVSLTSLAGAEASLSADAAVFVPIARPERVLAARRSRERTPPPRISSTFSSALACSSTAHGADHLDLAAGSTVIFTGLVSRADLVGKAGTVAPFEEASSRFAIIVVDTGESVRVLAKNLRPSSYSSSYHCTSSYRYVQPTYDAVPKSAKHMIFLF